MGSNCCKGDAAGRPVKSSSSIYSRSRAGASLDDRFTTSEDAGGIRLTVSAAHTGDSGVYTLQASNAAGKDSRRLRLEVSAEETPSGDDPPTFLRRLQDLTVKVGTRTRFLVEIVSSTECKVTWYRNERRLMEAERVALVRDGNFWCADVATVSVDDAGRWTCTAENAGGRASCSAHLNVLVPKAYKRPEFVEELRALLTEQGTVSLECKVVGVPTPVLRWFKDSREIKAGDVFALTANAEDPTSLGTYTCEAVNCMGRAYSSSKVHVIGRGSKDGTLRSSSGGVSPEPPPIFTKELQDQFVKICEPLTMSCHIVVPPWPRSVVWYNKEGKIEPSERYHVIEDGVGGYLLEVPSAEWPDEGEWKCVATSTGGRVGISTCYVTMDVPKNFRKPRFMENLQAVLTEEGLVSFECKVVGFPTPVLSWFKDGQELKPGDVYQLTGTNSLGSYCCIARNCMGQANSSAELTVEDIQNQLNEEEKLQLFSKNQAPKFLQGLKSVEAKIDEPFRFTVKVAIPPEPSVLWYRDDQPVDDSKRCRLGKEERGIFYLDIQTLEFLDQAEWKCVAMNDFGHSVTSCFLKLVIPRHYKKPRFLENLQAILSDEGAVNLECKVIGVPQPVLKWYKDGEELKPGDIHRIISGQDGTCCLGTYTCEAQNCMGIAASSASLLGFDDSMKMKGKKKTDEQTLQRNLSLSTIHEERTSQMYDTPVGDITLDEKGEISFSFDGKEVSVSLYETPDLTEEEALQIVEMYADQLSENITEHNVVELPPLRFVKETSTSGNLLMEAIIIDVSPEYFTSPEEDLRTEADIEDISIAEENGPPQLSLDHEFNEEDNIEKSNVLVSDEKADIHQNLSRKKSDSQKSGDYFSFSHDHSLSDEKRDDDTPVLSESDLQSFASAHSSEKLKSFKPSPDDGPESSEVTKTTVYKGEIGKNYTDQETHKLRRERRSSCSSRKSSSESEISHTNSKEQLLHKCESVNQSLSPHKEFEEKVNTIKLTLSIIMNDLHILEKDIILKSELMSSVATASKSLEIINSLLTPLSEIYTITEAAIESINEINNVKNNIFKNMPESLRSLQQSLIVIEKCIDIESENKTLVKKTCISLIEKCGEQMQDLMSNIISVNSIKCFKMEDKTLFDIQSLTNEVNNILNFTADTIKTKNLLIEASELRVDELTSDVKHLKDTQKCIYELKRPVISLLNIVENAEKCETSNSTINSSSVILADMSASIQDLQSALEQIESLSLKESTTIIKKYNTEIIDAVMNSVLKLRSSFEHLSLESKNIDDSVTLKQNITLVKSNLNDIFLQLKLIENNIGCFDILQSDNKLEALQKMAQVLISLENNLPRLEVMSNLKDSMELFHKQLTKILENVIESNDAEKYFALMEIWDALKRVNNSICGIDSQSQLCLAGMSNSLKIIKDCVDKNVFESELNKSVITNICDILICIQEVLNQAENESLNIQSEYIQQTSERELDKIKADIVMEQIDQTLAAIAVVTSHHALEEQGPLLPVIENICPLLEELKRSVACIGLSGIEREEHISEITEIFSQTTETLAKPLCELNRHISVLNEIILENPESFSEGIQHTFAFAQPLKELYKSLETMQHNIISQLGNDLSPYELNKNVANTVQNLYSTTLMIHENIGIEAADEISTLEDISGIKTMAETNLSDDLLFPVVNETEVQQSLESMYEFKQSAVAQALHILNKHIITIQNLEIMNTLEALSEKSQYSNLRSLVEGLANLHAKIEENLSPIVINNSQYYMNYINTSKLVSIAELMLELQQSLSIVDISNIPIFEDILDISSDTIHSVFQGITEFKNHLEACIQIFLPALEIADKTVKISYHIDTLKESCVLLTDLLTVAKINYNTSLIDKNIEPLEVMLVNFLHSFDISRGIKVENIKTIIEDLYDNILILQEEIVPLTSWEIKEPEKLQLIQTLNDIEANIVILEQFNFVELSKSLDCYYRTSFDVIEVKSEPLFQVEDIIVSTTDVLENLENKGKGEDLVEVEKFIRTCKSEFIIMRSLITKQLTFKRIMRIYQINYLLRNAITSFNSNISKFNLSDETKCSLLNFISKANTCQKSAQLSLIKIFECHTDMIYTTPLAILSDNSKYLSNISEKNISPELADLIITFLKVVEILLPTIENEHINVINELNNFTETETNEKEILDEWNKFVKLIEQTYLTKSFGIEYDQKLENILCCIQQHSYIKDAPGSGKQLILLMCMAECSQMLKQMKELKAHDLSTKISLNETLTRMIISLNDLNKQIGDWQKSNMLEIDKTNSMNVESLEPYIETLTEICEDLKHDMQTEAFAITEIDKSLMSEINKEIDLIQYSLQSLDDKRVKDMVKTLNTIGKSVNIILSSEKEENDKNILKANFEKLLNHLAQYIDVAEILEKIPAVTKFENLVPSMNLAKGLLTTLVESVSISEEVKNANGLNDIVKNADKQIHNLQESISMLQVQLLKHCSSATLDFDKDDFQHGVEVISDLQEDLLAISARQTIVNMPNNGNELNKETAIIDNHQASWFNDKAIKSKEMYPVLEGAVDERLENEFEQLVYKDNEVPPLKRDAIDLHTQFDNGNSNTEYLQECEILSDKTHTQKNTANVEIILGEVVNHLEEFVSCSDIVSRLVLLTNTTNLKDCIKTAIALKEKITESLLSPEIFSPTGYIDENYASLPQEFYETLKILQKEMHNKAKELSAEFDDFRLQHVNNVLTSLELNIHAAFISEETTFEELNNNMNFNITTASEFPEETLSKNNNEKIYSEKSVFDSKTPQEIDNIDKISIKYISKIPICSEVLEQIESTQESLQQLEESNKIVATSFVSNEENDLIVTKNLVSFSSEDTLDKSVNDNNKKNLSSSTDIKQKDALYKLKSLLQEVCDKIDMLATVKIVDDTEVLQNTLDEIQAVIIELKCDYDGSVSDTLNETLEDLECSVRSVQLQIHEDSPPELLKEACAVLQLLVTNMCGLQELHLSHNMPTEVKLDNILQKCSNDTATIVDLLDATLELKTNDSSEFSILIADLNTLKCLIKSLKSIFDENMETLIEKGIEINQNLDLVEDRVFTLEKDVDLNKKLSSNDRDTIITVIHSVYGSISNMRSAITSVQKQYMFENYGKPSKHFLNALKNIALIVQTSGESNWKKLAKSLRKVLNHFEDIKFYINFDKTARLPSDAAFTKIILLDLKSVINEVILANETQLSPEIKAITRNTAVCIESRLLDIEDQSHLEVKEKIPIFKSIAYQVHLLTESIKDYLIVNTDSQDNEGKTINRNKTITEMEDINILYQDVSNAETINIDLSEQSTIAGPLKTEYLEKNKEKYYECDKKNEIDLLDSEAEIIQSKINVLVNESNKSQNYSEINDENSIKLDTCLVNDFYVNTEISIDKIETGVPNFALEVIPESVISENILEQSLLKIGESKPLEASQLHVVETRVLYEAQTVVAVTGQLNEFDTTFDQKVDQEVSYESDKLEICVSKSNQLSTCIENEFTQNSGTVTDLVNNQNHNIFSEKIEMMDSKQLMQQEYVPSNNSQVSVTIELPSNNQAESKVILENNVRESNLKVQSQTSLIAQDNENFENNENFEEDNEKKDLNQLGNDMENENERVRLNKSESQITFDEYKRKSNDGQDILEKKEKKLPVKEMKLEESNLALELNKGDKEILVECENTKHTEINANVMETIDDLTSNIKMHSKSSESMNPSQDTIDQEKQDEDNRTIFEISKENEEINLESKVKPEVIKQVAEQSQDSAEINNFVQEQDKAITGITMDNYKSVHVNIDKNYGLASDDIRSQSETSQSSDLCQGILNHERGKIQRNENNQNVLNMPEKDETLQEKVKSDEKIQATGQLQGNIEPNGNIKEQDKVNTEITIDRDTVKHVEINKNDMQSINDLATNPEIMQLERSQLIEPSEDKIKQELDKRKSNDDEIILDKSIVMEKIVKEEDKEYETKILVPEQPQETVEINSNVIEQNKVNIEVTVDSDTIKHVEITESESQTNNGIAISEAIIQVKKNQSSDLPIDTMDNNQDKIMLKDDVEIVLDKSKGIEGKIKEKKIEHETKIQATGQLQGNIEPNGNIKEQDKVNTEITIDRDTVKHVEINKNDMQSINDLATNPEIMQLERSQLIEPSEDKIKQELGKRKSNDDEIILDKSIVMEKIVKEEDKEYETKILVPEQPQETVEINSNLIEQNKVNIDVTVDSDTIKHVEITESESQTNNGIAISETYIQVKKNQSNDLPIDTMDQDKIMLKDDVEIVLDKSKGIEGKIKDKEIEHETKIQVTDQSQGTIEINSNITEKNKENTNISEDSDTQKYLEVNRNEVQSNNDLETSESIMRLKRNQTFEISKGTIDQEQNDVTRKAQEDDIFDHKTFEEKSKEKVIEQKTIKQSIEHLQDIVVINNKMMDYNIENPGITLDSNALRYVENNKNVELLTDLNDLKTCDESIQLKDSLSSTAVQDDNKIYKRINENEETENILKNDIAKDKINKSYISEEIDSHKLLQEKETKMFIKLENPMHSDNTTIHQEEIDKEITNVNEQNDKIKTNDRQADKVATNTEKEKESEDKLLLEENELTNKIEDKGLIKSTLKLSKKEQGQDNNKNINYNKKGGEEITKEGLESYYFESNKIKSDLEAINLWEVNKTACEGLFIYKEKEKNNDDDKKDLQKNDLEKPMERITKHQKPNTSDKKQDISKYEAETKSLATEQSHSFSEINNNIIDQMKENTQMLDGNSLSESQENGNVDNKELTNNNSIKDVSKSEKELITDKTLVKELEKENSYFHSAESEETYLNLQNEAISNMVQSMQLSQDDLNIQEIDKINEILGIKNTAPKLLTDLDALKEVQEFSDKETIKSKSVHIENNDSNLDFGRRKDQMDKSDEKTQLEDAASLFRDNVTEFTKEHVATDRVENVQKVYDAEEKKLNKTYEVSTEEKQGRTERQNSKIEVLNNTIESKKCDKIEIAEKEQLSEEKVDVSETKIKDQSEKNAFRAETINEWFLNEAKIKTENIEERIREEINDHKESIKGLEKSFSDQINVRLNKQTEFNLSQHSRSNEFLNNVAECEPKEKNIFVDRAKGAFGADCDYSMSEINMEQIQTFYKVQTIAYDSQLRSSLPPSYEDPKNIETAERNLKYNQKSKAQSETRNITTQKRPLRDIQKKPVFSTYLTDRTAVEGSRVKLTCSVLASSEPIILWYKNGVPLDNKLKYRTKYIDGLITMEVLNAVPSDSAEYRCTVETENGSVTTCANLKVYPSFEASPIPPTFTRSIRDIYNLAENELILECRIRGQPLPTITWLKDDRPISSYGRYQAYYLADGVCRLVINSPCPEDSGKYTCKAENSIWSDQINHIVTFSDLMRPRSNLTTWEKSRIGDQIIEGRRPHFTNVLTDYKVSKGGTIGLQVEIKGSPTRVEWLREGRSITEIYRNAETFVDHGLYTLALSDVTEKESGVYTCRAWSKNDKVDMNAAITVVPPNEIDGKPAVIIGRPQKDILISVGADINISFRVHGEPKPKVIFMKGIRDITNSQRVCKMTSDDYVKFTLKRSVVSDAGTYCIFARNAFGCDRAFVTVAVRQRASSENLISDWTYPIDDSVMTVAKQRFKSVPNRIPGEPSVVDGGNNWVSLAWPKPDSQSGSSVIAYKVESWLLGKEGGARWTELGITPLNSFDVFNLKQGEGYHFRVTPRNRYGWGESVQTTSPIGVGLAGDRPEFVDILPGQLKVLVGETISLKCRFKGKPIPEIVWMKNGHEIDEEDSRINTSLNGTDCCLTINDVKIEDEARYSCEATNVHGRTSTYARVAVITDRLIWEADAKLKRERSADVGGEYPPQFTMRLRDRRVQATYPVRLTCQVVGRPSPIVTWLKDGEEVTNDARHTKSQDELFHTLEIAPTNLEDGGVYEAMARNNSGAISCHCNLVVDKGIRAYVAPEFCCGLEPLYEVSVGDELRISAVVEAYPSVGVTWFRDGIRLRPSRRAVMTLDHDGQIELAVAPITHRDAGIYTCTASNEVGKASTSGKVEVFGDSTEERNQTVPTVICPNVPYSKEPMFIRKPRSSEAREGDTVIIACEVIGDPKPEVYWLRDFLRPDYYRDASHFKRIGAGPEYRFEIPHAKLDYTGAYSVVARNIYGEAKAIISLQILAKDPTSSEETHNIRYGRVEVIPRFEKELTDLLSHDGDAVEFECRVTGNPEPDIKWYHYTDIIRNNVDFETTYELGTARLKIKQVTADDEGTYTCEAYNNLGKAKSSACLVVYAPGEPNTLSQRLRRPPALLSTTSTPHSTPRSTPARSLSRNRTPGPDMRSLCSPVREVAPKFYTYPFNKVAEEGDTVVFQCAVKGLPAPWTTWDKDGVVITPSSRITIKEKDEILRILEIEEVTSEDVGLYRVTLENDYGRAEASARLEVISQRGKFYAGGRSYSASPRKSYRRSRYSPLPRQD